MNDEKLLECIIENVMNIEDIARIIKDYAKPERIKKEHKENIEIVASLQMMDVLKRRYVWLSHEHYMKNREDINYKPIYYEDVINRYINREEQLRILKNLRKCSCCQRHQECRPDYLTEYGEVPVNPNPNKKSKIYTYDQNGDCMCSCRHKMRCLYASIQKKIERE